MLSFFLAPINRLCAPHRADNFCDWELARLAAISSSKRRQEYIAGHALLRLAAQHALGVSADIDNTLWQQPANSAPQLTQHPDLHFGLSHSAGWVAALIESTDDASSGEKSGIDIELERERKNLNQLASYSFTEDWLQQHSEQLLPAFFQRWTMCEALVKGSQKTLGTALLRNQQFTQERQVNADNWLYHARLTPKLVNHPSLAPSSALHISLCSERFYQPHQIQGFALSDGVLVALDAIDFSIFRAP